MKRSGNVDMTSLPAILASGLVLSGLEWSGPSGVADQHCSIVQHSFNFREHLHRVHEPIMLRRGPDQVVSQHILIESTTGQCSIPC